MHVTRIEMRGFMSHADTTVELPRRGIVAITGPNGSGKSSIIEAVAYALWGKTLRGSDPWPGDTGYLKVEFDSLVVARTVKGGKKALEWRLTGSADPPTKYESMTKAQDALEQVVGPFRLWSRTSVFSSHDASHFTLATDAERKRLLEAILGLDRFDPALEECRRDRTNMNASVASVGQALERVKVSTAYEAQRLKEAEGMLAEMGAVPADVDLSARRRVLEEAADAAHTDVCAASDKLNTLALSGAGSNARAQEIKRRLGALSGDTCDRCGQPIPKALVEQLSAQVRQIEEQARRELEEAKIHIDALKIQVDNDKALERDARAELYKIDTASQAQVRVAGARKNAESIAKAARDSMAGCELSRASLEKELVGATAGLGELQASEAVLGLKGVRAQVLGKALSGIEAVANSWLARISGGTMSLGLSPYSERKSGDVADAIALKVRVGSGECRGYRDRSGGERRRVDISLLLALSEVSAAANGVEPGTLFMDECFDALDTAGIEAVAGSMDMLCRDRAVVLISHSAELVGSLVSALRITL